MATDKALPNVQQTIKLPSPKDVQIEQQQQTAQQMTEPVDIQKNEDGSVDINFDLFIVIYIWKIVVIIYFAA